MLLVVSSIVHVVVSLLTEDLSPLREAPLTAYVDFGLAGFVRFGLGTAICFAICAIFIRNGLEGLPSPLLGVSVGMIITAVIYGLVLIF